MARGVRSSASSKAQDIQKEMFASLRRLYRLYLHAFYQHYGAFAEAEKRRHMYAKFFGFVTCSGLLSERDMKPYLSLDEMNEYVYSSFSLCCIIYDPWRRFFRERRRGRGKRRIERSD